MKQYISAIQENNGSKQYELTFYSSDSDVVQTVVEDFEEESELPAPFLTNNNINIDKQCIIRKTDKIEIDKIEQVFSRNTENSNISTDWPSDIHAAYNVIVKNAKKSIEFIVVQDNNNNFKIYSTNGLYTYDISTFSDKIGCNVDLKSTNNDDTMGQYISHLLKNYRNFDIFAKAVASKDSSKLIKIFPNSNGYKISLHGAIIPKSYKQISADGEAIIICNDSTIYKINSNGKIIDCMGVISTTELEDEIKSQGEIPKNRLDRYDIQYLKALKNQITEIAQEKERKAKVAKYRSQGVALVDSRFSSDGNGGKGIKFTALNTSTKSAKYIIMEVVGYNSVDDPVWSDGYLKRCRGIGPIAPGESGTWDFNDIWKNGGIVDSYEIKNLIIEFTDGTTKRVKLPQNLPSNWRNWLY